MSKSILKFVCVLTVFLFFIAIIFRTTSVDEATVLGQESELSPVRVGVLVSGSVHWQVETIKKYEFDKLNGVNVIPVPLGSINALLVALQGGAVDIIVSDWVWVTNQYAHARYFKFYPFSSALGGVVAPIAKGLSDVNDLVGKRVGVAGGPEGKSWLLFKAYARLKFDIDLQVQSTIKYVAPPLLNALLESEKIDAGLNYWHFNAVLDNERYRELLSGQDILNAFGLPNAVPTLGWVFNREWAQQNRQIVDGFLTASGLATQQLKQFDDAWVQVEHLLKPEQKKHSTALRDSFREGMIEEFNDSDIENIQFIYTLLEKSRVNKSDRESLVALPKDIFWQIEGG